jgi:hypothetical protein
MRIGQIALLARGRLSQNSRGSACARAKKEALVAGDLDMLKRLWPGAGVPALPAILSRRSVCRYWATLVLDAHALSPSHPWDNAARGGPP